MRYSLLLLALIASCVKNPSSSQVKGAFDKDKCEQVRADSESDFNPIVFQEMYTCREVSSPVVDKDAQQVTKSNLCLFKGKETKYNQQEIYQISGYLAHLDHNKERETQIVELIFDHAPDFSSIINNESELSWSQETKRDGRTSFTNLRLDKKNGSLLLERRVKDSLFSSKKMMFSTQLSCRKII